MTRPPPHRPSGTSPKFGEHEFGGREVSIFLTAKNGRRFLTARNFACAGTGAQMEAAEVVGGGEVAGDFRFAIGD